MSSATTVTVISRTGSLQMNRGPNTDEGLLTVRTYRQAAKTRFALRHSSIACTSHVCYVSDLTAYMIVNCSLWKSTRAAVNVAHWR